MASGVHTKEAPKGILGHIGELKKLRDQRRGKSILAHTMKAIENKIIDCDIKTNGESILCLQILL